MYFFYGGCKFILDIHVGRNIWFSEEELNTRTKYLSRKNTICLDAEVEIVYEDK